MRRPNGDTLFLSCGVLLMSCDLVSASCDLVAGSCDLVVGLCCLVAGSCDPQGVFTWKPLSTIPIDSNWSTSWSSSSRNCEVKETYVPLL